jgi:hypothetical protein
VAAPVRQEGGGAETRRAARNERKQKTAVLQGAARPQAVKRSRCGPQEFGRMLSDLLFQPIIVMQSAEDRL